MPFSYLHPVVAIFFLRLSDSLDRRSGARLPAILCGILFAKGRRAATSWFRPAGVTTDFRNAYTAINSVGRKTRWLARHALDAVRPVLGKERPARRHRRHPHQAVRPRGRGGRHPPPSQRRDPPTSASSTATSSSPSPPWPAIPRTA